MRRSSFSRLFERPPRRMPDPVPAGQWRIGEPINAPADPVVKDAPMRSEPYRRWVASLPCAMCNRQGLSQAAHANAGKGMALKVCDSRLFPACGPHGINIGCHRRIDLSVDMTRAERRALEDRLVAETQALAVANGWNLKTLRRPV